MVILIFQFHIYSYVILTYNSGHMTRGSSHGDEEYETCGDEGNRNEANLSFSSLIVSRSSGEAGGRHQCLRNPSIITEHSNAGSTAPVCDLTR